LFEFIPNAETLQDFLRGHYHDIDPSLKNHIALKLIEAINYLHANGISHRDIKTDNVMIGENGLVKLIDFGFATTVVKG
jgi:serine/threonine protein kinase